jgi:hypothetical protein
MTDKIILAADTPKPEVNAPSVTPAPQPDKGAPMPAKPSEDKTPVSK